MTVFAVVEKKILHCIHTKYVALNLTARERRHLTFYPHITNKALRINKHFIFIHSLPTAFTTITSTLWQQSEIRSSGRGNYLQDQEMS